MLDGIVLAHFSQVEEMTEEQFFGNLKDTNMFLKVRIFFPMLLVEEALCLFHKMILKTKNIMQKKIKLKLEKIGKQKKFGEIIKVCYCLNFKIIYKSHI